MENMALKKLRTKVAVVGVGYWGKNIVRNFNELGGLGTLCDAENSIEADCKRKYDGVKFYRE